MNNDKCEESNCDFTGHTEQYFDVYQLQNHNKTNLPEIKLICVHCFVNPLYYVVELNLC